MPERKLVLISGSQVPSSAANSIQVMKVCQAFAQTGWQTSLLVPGSQGVSWEELAPFYGLRDRFEIEWIPAQTGLHRYDLAWKAVQRANRLKAEAIYTWMPQAALLGLLFGYPVLLEMHEPPSGRFGPVLFKLFSQVPGRKRLLPITRALEKILQDRYRYASSAFSSVIVPDGVDLERYQNLPDPPTARRMLALPERPTAGYTGHLYAGRGMGLLMELARSFPEMQFLWIGGRPEDVQTWRTRLQEARISNVTLTGFIENARLPIYQAAAECLLMPYERSIQGSSGGNTADYCSPMKMFEYMACERAILTSDLPVLHEVLDETRAVFCPPEDLQSWKQALTALMADPERRQALSIQARQAVLAYSWERRARRSLEGFL